MLDLLVDRGKAERIDPQRDAWCLTEAGYRSITRAHGLTGGELALMARDGVPLEDATVFEVWE